MANLNLQDEPLPESLDDPAINRALARLGAIPGATYAPTPGVTTAPSVTGLDFLPPARAGYEALKSILGARPERAPKTAPDATTGAPDSGPAATPAAAVKTPPEKAKTSEEDRFTKAEKEYEAMAKEKVPQPEQQKLPQPPPVKPEDYKTFVGMALLFAALAGHSSRAPMTAALNAFSGAVKGHMDGEKEIAAKEAAAFKQKTDLAIKNNQMELDKYKRILDYRKMRMGDKINEMRLIAMEDRNAAMLQAAKDRRLDSLQRAYEKQANDAQRLAQQAATMHASLVRAGIESPAQAKTALGESGAPPPPKTAPEKGGMSVGTIITRGGKQYKVVGKDSDGTPLVEPVQ